MSFHLSRKKKIVIAILLIFVAAYIFCLPSKLFNLPVSTVLLDKNGDLLDAHIAADGQWRFPQLKNVPTKFATAIIHFEDKRFYSHLGFDIFALLRATYQNISEGKIVSGGSTLTMQVIRLMRGQKRTFLEKIFEIILASRLEFSYSKQEILSFYASYAPFGGNIVGLETASWRYFGRKSSDLSWAESAMLAVLPNSPSLIHLSKNRTLLLEKRNSLLKKLFENQIFDKETYDLAISESLPESPKEFPNFASHLLVRSQKEKPRNSLIKTTLDKNLQTQIIHTLSKHYRHLSGNGIFNAAVLVVEVENGNVLSYVGNINFEDSARNHCNNVDVIVSDRSSGSVLKPFLYAAMLSSGEILPEMLIPDVPTYLGSYRPQNFSRSFEGAVPAKRALAKSLNVPAVKMLQNFGVAKFHYLLKQVGLTSVTKPSEHYGLSLILGGCECKLWDLVGIYASMARSLQHFSQNSGLYDRNDYFSPQYFFDSIKVKRKKPLKELNKSSFFSAGAIYLTFNALVDVERPEEEGDWEMFSSSQKIAWKTGTSFGFRDAWAVGVTPKYVVGVWVGNADGEGRPNLVGIKVAAPILFDIFSYLPVSQDWFNIPFDDLKNVEICKESGYRASNICPERVKKTVSQAGEQFALCPYHKIIHLDKSLKFQVSSDCENIENIENKVWFILPPVMEFYYKPKHSNYVSVPPFREDCLTSKISTHNIDILYPESNSQIYLPTELTGREGKTVFEAIHRKPNTTIFWHVDDKYVGETKDFHQIAVQLPKGVHTLTLIDEFGEKISRYFEIIDKKRN